MAQAEDYHLSQFKKGGRVVAGIADDEKRLGELGIHMSHDTFDTLKSRLIMPDAVREVIAHAEATGDKLYLPGKNRYLARMSHDRATIYVDYSVELAGGYTIHTAYGHQVEIKEGP
jgi:hypothetical protein